MRDVSIIIPAHNEAETIGKTVTALTGLPHVKEILVVDDGSLDKTAALASRAGAEVIVHQKNLGKGAALTRGVAAARGDYICFLDADLGETAAEAVKLYVPVRERQADISIARFPRPKTRGGFGIATNLARYGLYLYTKTFFFSPLSGQRAMTMQAAEALAPYADGFGVEVGLTIDAHRRGFKLLEVPVNMSHRETGRNWKGFYHRGKQCCHVARVLLQKAWRKA